MKTAIALIALLAPVVAFAQPPIRIDNPGIILPPIFVNESRSSSGAVATGGAGGAGGAASASAGSVTSNYRGSAIAPDVTAFPTAPCRVAGGVSGGWFGGAIGINGSVLDESCDLQNMSNTLSNRGQKAASIQILCLHDNARKAMEATGVKCLIANELPAAIVKP